MKKFACSLAIVVAALVCAVLAPNTYAKYVSSDSESFKLSVHMPKYTVIFDANGGTGTMEPQEFTYGAEPVALTANTFEREDYTFIGWNTSADGLGQGYADGEPISNLSSTDGTEITLYAQWEYAPMPVVFESAAVCEFHGEIDGIPQPITGDDCEYAGLTYIDTGWKLYSEENYEKDFEIGFKIVEYNSNANVLQATFANSKYDDGTTNGRNPGFVVRKSGNNIEISQKINGVKIVKTFPGNSVTEVKIARVDSVVYYSVNGSDYTVLQSNKNTTDYHDIPVWFGATPTNEVDEDGNWIPTRYLTGKLSDIFIRVGNYSDAKRVVTFHAGEGATVNPTEKVFINDSTMGTMPTPTWNGHAFVGWFTEDGRRVREDELVTDNMDLYAHWLDDNNICEVNVGGNTVKKDTLAGCITEAGTSAATISILTDIKANVTVDAGQDITFDLGSNIWSDNAASAPVISNNGTVHIINGTITQSKNDAVINNNTANSEVYVSGGNIVATGSKQAIYNTGGYVEISGDATLSSVSTNRATVHNLSGGNTVILGGTIVSTGSVAVRNEAIMTIGEQGNGIAATPVIRGKTNGVWASSNLDFYDGIIMGGSAAINNRTKIVNHDGALTDGTTEIDDVTYHTLYNE